MVGRETDILIGIKYAKYFPKTIFECDSGLGIYESFFLSSDGTRGVISGLHEEFAKIERTKKGLHVNKYIYLQTLVYEYREFHKLGNDMPLLGSNDDFQMQDCDFSIHCPKRTVHMQYVAENVAVNVDVHCSMLDVDGLGKEDWRDVKTNKTANAVNLYLAKKPSQSV